MCVAYMKLNKQNTSLKLYTFINLLTPDKIQEMGIMGALSLNQVWKIKKHSGKIYFFIWQEK